MKLGLTAGAPGMPCGQGSEEHSRAGGEEDGDRPRLIAGGLGDALPGGGSQRHDQVKGERAEPDPLHQEEPGVEVVVVGVHARLSL